MRAAWAKLNIRSALAHKLMPAQWHCGRGWRSGFH